MAIVSAHKLACWYREILATLSLHSYVTILPALAKHPLSLKKDSCRAPYIGIQTDSLFNYCSTI